MGDDDKTICVCGKWKKPNLPQCGICWNKKKQGKPVPLPTAPSTDLTRKKSERSSERSKVRIDAPPVVESEWKEMTAAERIKLAEERRQKAAHEAVIRKRTEEEAELIRQRAAQAAAAAYQETVYCENVRQELSQACLGSDIDRLEMALAQAERIGLQEEVAAAAQQRAVVMRRRSEELAVLLREQAEILNAPRSLSEEQESLDFGSIWSVQESRGARNSVLEEMASDDEGSEGDDIDEEGSEDHGSDSSESDAGSSVEMPIGGIPIDGYEWAEELHACVSMGFESELSKEALVLTNGNVDAAISVLADPDFKGLKGLKGLNGAAPAAGGGLAPEITEEWAKKHRQIAEKRHRQFTEKARLLAEVDPATQPSAAAANDDLSDSATESPVEDVELKEKKKMMPKSGKKSKSKGGKKGKGVVDHTRPVRNPNQREQTDPLLHMIPAGTFQAVFMGILALTVAWVLML